MHAKTNIIAPLTAADNGALAADVLFILWHPPGWEFPVNSEHSQQKPFRLTYKQRSLINKAKLTVCA